MKCENCGAELEEDTQFCSNCGSTVKKNNKNNKDSLKNNISLGNFNFSLKSIIIIIVALIILIGVFSMLMGNGNDVTVNGISFHLPDGYNKVEEITLDEGVKGEGFSYSNDADHEFTKIEVRDVDMKDINDLKINFPATKQSVTIDGKEGILALDSSSRNHFYYLEGDKLVCINAPFVEIVTGKSNEDVISDIIKWGEKNGWRYCR